MYVTKNSSTETIVSFQFSAFYQSNLGWSLRFFSSLHTSSMESQRPKRSLGAQSSSDTFANPPLKRNIEYSCDRCRSKKLKCNRRRPVNPKPGLPVADNELGSRLELPGQLELEGPCKNCATANAECTWGKVCVPRAPPKKYAVGLWNEQINLFFLS